MMEKSDTARERALEYLAGLLGPTHLLQAKQEDGVRDS